MSSSLRSRAGEMFGGEESSAGGDGDAEGEEQVVDGDEDASDASCT